MQEKKERTVKGEDRLLGHALPDKNKSYTWRRLADDVASFSRESIMTKHLCAAAMFLLVFALPALGYTNDAAVLAPVHRFIDGVNNGELSGFAKMRLPQPTQVYGSIPTSTKGTAGTPRPLRITL